MANLFGHDRAAQPRAERHGRWLHRQGPSANGEHFVFGSTSRFTEDGNSNGDVSIYDRNLRTDETHVVSKTSGPAPGVTFHVCRGRASATRRVTAPGLPSSTSPSNGSHILVGQLVSTSEEGPGSGIST